MSNTQNLGLFGTGAAATEGRVRDHYWTLDLFRRALTLQVGKVWNIPATICHNLPQAVPTCSIW